jgi:hypothetical protein
VFIGKALFQEGLNKHQPSHVTNNMSKQETQTVVQNSLPAKERLKWLIQPLAKCNQQMKQEHELTKDPQPSSLNGAQENTTN